MFFIILKYKFKIFIYFSIIDDNQNPCSKLVKLFVMWAFDQK